MVDQNGDFVPFDKASRGVAGLVQTRKRKSLPTLVHLARKSKVTQNCVDEVGGPNKTRIEFIRKHEIPSQGRKCTVPRMAQAHAAMSSAGFLHQANSLTLPFGSLGRLRNSLTLRRHPFGLADIVLRLDPL